MTKMEIVLLIWNFIVMILYGIDKLRAKKGVWRISEATLIVPAFLFGSVGAMLGMILFNHKTSKIKFRLLVTFAFVLNLAVVLLLEYYTKKDTVK